MKDINQSQTEQVSGGLIIKKPPITSLYVGEEGHVTTLIYGEEGGHITTLAIGEEGSGGGTPIVGPVSGPLGSF